MTVIKIKGGNNPLSMPTLQNRELGYAYDNNGLYIGWNGANILLNPTGNSTSGLTPEGGFYITLTNQTGAASIKGTVVRASRTFDNACEIAPSGSDEPIGVIYDSGIANGSPVRVVVGGKAYCLMQDSIASTRGYWVGVSGSQNGRVYFAVDPSSATVHWAEMGHCLESVTAGTNKLALCNLHFN